MTGQTKHNIPEIDFICIQSGGEDKTRKISTPSDAFHAVAPLWDRDTIDDEEQIRVLLLNPGYEAIGVHTLAKGRLLDIGDLHIAFALAIKANAKRMILATSHPSILPFPTNEDINLTRVFRTAANNLDMELVDHLIICRNGFTSITMNEIAYEYYNDPPKP